MLVRTKLFLFSNVEVYPYPVPAYLVFTRSVFFNVRHIIKTEESNEYYLSKFFGFGKSLEVIKRRECKKKYFFLIVSEFFIYFKL